MPWDGHLPRPATGGTSEDVRRHNLGALLGHLHADGPLSRTELARRTRLNRSTIAALVTELASAGAVREDRPARGQAAVGRPSLLVSPRGEHVQVLAADVGVDQVDVALVGLGGQIVDRRHRRLTVGSGPRTVTSLIVRMVEALRRDRCAGGAIVGLGVALPGVIRHVDGFVRFAPNLGWADEHFGGLLAAALPGLPVRVGNDADLGALAEHLRGAGRGCDDLVFIAGGVGVGGGVIVSGRPLLGAGGYAGEVGHMVMRPGGSLCRCGARGCWETEIGASAIARALGAGRVSSDDLVRSIRRAAIGALDEVGRYLGLGIGSIVNLVNPNMVIVGGVLREVYPAARDAVESSLAGTALAAPGEQVRIVLPDLGGDAVLIGAAELAWAALLADPLATLREGAALPP
jgi:predicted NBD/HSP70 family sugar kinase